jgi:phage FluMu protein Com
MRSYRGHIENRCPRELKVNELRASSAAHCAVWLPESEGERERERERAREK